MDEMFTGPTVNSPDDLRVYTGLAAAERIVGQQRRAAYIVNYNQLDVNYSGTVDFQLRRELVVLCPQTAAFLYRSYTPERTIVRRWLATRVGERRAPCNAVQAESAGGQGAGADALLSRRAPGGRPGAFA